MTQTKTNLFTTGTKVKETGKKPEKKTIKAAELGNKIEKFAKLKDEIDLATGQLKMIEGDIKAAGKELFLKEYKELKSTPENFKIQDETGATCLFIVMDKYTSVDEGKAEVLEGFDGLLQETTVYTMNADLVDKYGQILSDLILNCKKIADEDKANLIKGEKTFAVKKGSIDRLMLYPDPSQVFELINPICALKK